MHFLISPLGLQNSNFLALHDYCLKFTVWTCTILQECTILQVSKSAQVKSHDDDLSIKLEQVLLFFVLVVEILKHRYLDLKSLIRAFIIGLRNGIKLKVTCYKFPPKILFLVKSNKLSLPCKTNSKTQLLRSKNK